MSNLCDDEPEWRKRITALLVQGATFVLIDNVAGIFGSSTLSAALTSSLWKDRILGRSEIVCIPHRAVWAITGNNFGLTRDLARRCYWIRLDAACTRPSERSRFMHPELLAWVAERRGELIGALLTLARAWYAASCPAAPIRVFGGFENWAKVVGGILHHAGMQGFLSHSGEIYDADSSAAEWDLFLHSLEGEFGNSEFTVREVVERIALHGKLRDWLPLDLAEYVAVPGSFERRLGRALARRRDVRFGEDGIYLQRAGEAQRAIKWRVVVG
jgi:hypothetical protein